MKTRLTIPALALAATLLSPGMASASLLLDTGTPTGSTDDELTSSQWFAVEFEATAAAPTITELAAYLGAGGTGTTFTFDLYSASNPFLNESALNRGAILFTAPGTFNGSTGWSTASGLDWSLTPGQDYWLALEASTTGKYLDVVTGAPNNIAGEEALNFAFTTGGEFKTAGAPDIGVQVTAVPLPAAAWLLGSGLLGLGSLARRRRAVADPSIQR
jgi:hypothetical protein